MERNSHSARSGSIPCPLLDAEGTWDPSVFLGGWIAAISDLSVGRPIGEVAVVFEGDRFAGDGQASPCFRARSVTAFEVSPDAEDWLRPHQEAGEAIRPGDVVVKRVAPVSAAVVDRELPSLPVDGNLFVIRGLSEWDAWWVAFCLNFSPCADYLISKSGRTILGRLSLFVVRDWRPPQTPMAFYQISRRLSDQLSKRVFLTGQFARLESEVGAEILDRLDPVTDDELADAENASWAGFFPASALGDSWLPVHVRAKHRADSRRKGGDWRSIRAFLMLEAPSRQRLSSIEGSIRLLRLGDLSDLPVVPEDLPETEPQQPNRVFATPLAADDVLLSTLGSCPRVAFTPPSLDVPVFPVDHWERLRFRSHAGAYAMILRTEPVLEQLRTLATGSVQQFVRPDDIQRLQLPVLPEETLAQWDRSFRSLTRAWSQAGGAWTASLNEGWQIFTRALSQSSPAPTHP